MTTEEKLQTAAEFEKYPTGVISDAMDKLELQSGIVLGLHALSQRQRRTAGFAVTVRQMRRRAAWDGVNLARQSRVIDEELRPGDVLVIDMGGIRDVSTGGDLLALRAQMKGAKGELTNGCLRDVEDIEELGFPVWFAGGVPKKSAYDIETAGVNVPVTIGGVQIRPGDLILMDRTGVIAVPAEKLREVLETAAAITQTEERVTGYLREGLSLAEARRRAKEA